MDAQGFLYGVTEEGGSADGGILYKLSKTGKLTILHSFMGGTTDGCNVSGNAVHGRGWQLLRNNFLLRCPYSGNSVGSQQDGKEKLLHSFAGGTSDGEYPLAGVIVDAKGMCTALPRPVAPPTSERCTK